MQENSFNMIISLLFLGIGMAAMIRILVRAVKNKFAPVRTVKATVVDKHKIETFSKYSGNGKNEKYVVVFLVDGKKKSFYVSQFSFGEYRIKAKGILKYRGDKLIAFE